MHLDDNFQNRISLIFLHVSFLFIKLKTTNNKKYYLNFYQKIFDIIFKQIDLNMREIGYSDTTINKNMRFLVKSFYDILINCESYNKKSLKDKNSFLTKVLKQNVDKNGNNNNLLLNYFNKYHSFCLDLSLDSVLKGNVNFTYN